MLFERNIDDTTGAIMMVVFITVFIVVLFWLRRIRRNPKPGSTSPFVDGDNSGLSQLVDDDDSSLNGTSPKEPIPHSPDPVYTDFVNSGSRLGQQPAQKRGPPLSTEKDD